MAVPSTSLRKKGDMLLSGVKADHEKEPWGCEGKAASVRAWRALAPWCLEGLSGSAGPAG